MFLLRISIPSSKVIGNRIFKNVCYSRLLFLCVCLHWIIRQFTRNVTIISIYLLSYGDILLFKSKWILLCVECNQLFMYALGVKLQVR